MKPPPALGLVALGIYDAAVHAFVATLQGVAMAVVVADLPYPSLAASAGRISALLLIHLHFTWGVVGDADLPPISEGVTRVRGLTQGLATLNQDILRGIPSCWRVFWWSSHFSASLPLLAFVNNFSIMNPSLEPVCSRGGFHTLDIMPGYSWVIKMLGVGYLPTGAASWCPDGLRKFLADSHSGPPGWYNFRRWGASQLGHILLHCVAPIICGGDTRRFSRGSPPYHWETGGYPNRDAGYYYTP